MEWLKGIQSRHEAIMFRLTIPGFIGGSVLLLLLAAGSIVRAQEAAKSAPGKLSSQEAIEQALNVKCSCDFDKTPLSEVVAFLARQRKINFIIDRRALDEIGIDPIETSVTLKVSDIPFRSLLSLALERHDLAWTIRHEVLIVTSEEVAEANLGMKVYDVYDLVVENPYSDEGETGEIDFDPLIETITTTIQPESWDEAGGPASVDGFANRSIMALVVSQTPQVHQEISALLDSLRNKNEQTTRPRKQEPRKAATEKPDISPRVVAYRVFIEGDLKGTSGEQELIEMLKQFVEPESWKAEDAAARAIPGALVIRQKPAVHDQIRRLLSTSGVLQRAASKKFYDPVADDVK